MKKIFLNLYVKTILIIVLAALLVGAGFYIVSAELAKAQSQKILSKVSEAVRFNEELEKSRIEYLKLNQEKNVSEIISFDDSIEVLKKEFNEKINILSYKIDTKYINIQEIKKIAATGLNASLDFTSFFNISLTTGSAFLVYGQLKHPNSIIVTFASKGPIDGSSSTLGVVKFLATTTEGSSHVEESVGVNASNMQNWSLFSPLQLPYIK